LFIALTTSADFVPSSYAEENISNHYYAGIALENTNGKDDEDLSKKYGKITFFDGS